MSRLDSNSQRSLDSGPPAPCALWPVELKLTNLDWDPKATLIHFQGQYLTICDLDYSILQVEIQNMRKTLATVDRGEFCLVEDLVSGCWYRGQVHNRNKDVFDVFLIDHGSILSVDISHLASCSSDLLNLPPKVVCGFFANVLPLRECWDSVVEKYFLSIIGKSVTGYIQALLPHKVLILETPDINKDLVRQGFAKHVDTDTFLFLVEMLTEVPLKQNMQSVPDLLIKKPRGQKFLFKPSSIQGFEDILSFGMPKMSAGTRVSVRVTAAVNPGLFYCQMSSMAVDLEAISQRLATVCDYASTHPNRMQQENLGQLCSVKGKDTKWYRGFVQSLPVNSQVRVLFVDYGFCESVRVENVQRLPPDFLSQPIMAFPCSLSSVADEDNELKVEQFGFLKKGLLGRVLNVEIISFDKELNMYSVKVLNSEDDYGKEPKLTKQLPRSDLVFKCTKTPPQGGYLYCEAVVVQALCRTVQAEGLQIGSECVGYVECVMNPNHFWMRTERRNNNFEDMMRKMAEHFSQVPLNGEVLENPELGAICCAMYEKDRHFYRAIVTDNLNHGVEVLFIDFGNTGRVPHMLIKKIPEKLMSEAAFAFNCTLVNVIPLDEVWTKTSTDLFKKAVANRSLLVRVVHLRKDRVVVDLYWNESEHGQSITDFLISSNQAEYWTYTPSKPVEKNEKTEVTKHKQTNINRGTPNNTCCESMKQQAALKKANVKCMEVPPQILQEKYTISTKETPKVPGSVGIKPLKCELGWQFDVNCSHIISPSHFWCQMSNNLPVLEKLMVKIQQCYSTHTFPFQFGEMFCIVKSSEDGRWYRASITGQQKDCINVCLIDYGMIQQIKECNLQAMLPEFTELESQAFKCSLYNIIEPSDPKSHGEWNIQSCKIFQDFLGNGAFLIRCTMISQLLVAGIGLCNVVDLRNGRTQQSITNILMEQGMAKQVKVLSKRPIHASPVSFTYSLFNLSIGSEEEVYVTHVNSPWELYFQLDRNTKIIEGLETKVLAVNKNTVGGCNMTADGKMWLAKYLDGKWYRAMVHPVQSPLHVKVLFVDYGNTNIIERTNILPIPSDAADLLYTPMQAVSCCLACVPMKELFAEVKQWLEENLLNKPIKAVVVGIHRSAIVELYDRDIHINDKVNKLIANLTPTTKKKVSVYTGGRKAKSKCIIYPKQVRTPKRNTSHSQERLQLTSTKSNPTRCSIIQNVCPNSSMSEKCVPLKCKEDDKNGKQEMERHHSVEKIQPPHSTDETPKLSSLPDTRVRAGLRALCYASHVATTSNFFLQLQEDELDIFKMEEDLNSNPIKDSLMEIPTVDLRINDLVLAEYDVDGALYRAVVKGHLENDHFKIEFLDYGNSAVVGKDKIYSLMGEWISQPRLSIPCSLLETSTYETGGSFSDDIMEKALMVDFVQQSGTQWQVKIEILCDIAGFSVAPNGATIHGSVTVDPEIPALLMSTGRTGEMHSSDKQSSLTKTEARSQERAKSVGVLVSLKSRKLRLQSKITRHKSDLFRCPFKLGRASQSSNWRSVMATTMPPVIQAQDTERGMFLSMLKNGDFYVRLDKTATLSLVLTLLIATNVTACQMLAEEDIKKGLWCLVKQHEDNQWYRAVIEHISEGKCQALLLDHGVTRGITFGSLRELHSSVAQIPALAVLCRLNNHCFSRKKDAQETCRKARRWLVGRELEVLFVAHSEADKLWWVKVCINGLYLNLQPEITTLQYHSQEASLMPGGTQTMTLTAENQQETASLGTSYPQHLHFSPINMGQAYNGFATAVTTPFNFSIVLEDLLLILNTVSTLLHNLPNKLSPLPEAHLVPGSCCLLHLDTKNKWCRAVVLCANTTVVAHLVDYGHCVDVAYEDRCRLKTLPEELQRLPKITYPCLLRGVSPVLADGLWTDEAVVFFQQSLYQKNLQIYFREFVSDTNWEVDILVDGTNVAKELVDAGHGSYIDLILGLRFQPCTDPPHTPSSEDDSEREEDGGESSANEPDMASLADYPRERTLSTVTGFNQCLMM